MTKNKRILIVDDNPALHEDFRKILLGNPNSAKSQLSSLEKDLFGEAINIEKSGFGFELDFASQGEEAYHKAVYAYQNNRPYAMAFMDVRMPPGWDGIKTIAKLWEKVPITEVVICTAYSDYSFSEITSQLGQSERLLFLKKPFDSVEVLQMAIALTTKWNLEQANRDHLENLEQLVTKRTMELERERAKSLHSSRLAAIGEVAAGVAHEINNPLAIVQSYLMALRRVIEGEFDREKGTTTIAKIETAVKRIAKIIKALRNVSEDGDEYDFEQAKLQVIVSDTLDLCNERFSNHKIKLTVADIPEDLEIECRAVQVSQVLLNLLNNAHDAVENLPNKWVQVDVKSDVSQIEIRVTDSGSGISENTQEKLFQPFFTTKEVGKGTGLGLSISKGLMEAHQGKLWYDNTSKNTSFVITLPRQQSSLRKVA